MKYEMAVFDVNETLLDLSALAPAFQAAVGTEVSMGEWFGRLLHRSLVSNHLGQYQPFGELGSEALTWLAQRRGVEVDPARIRDVMIALTALPAHPDVAKGLEAVATTGIKVVALTNGSVDALSAQLSNAGIAHLFDKQMSVESVRRFKPAPEVYLHAAAVSGVDIDRMIMVAAHDWDIAGAQSVGAAGCFVARQPWGMPLVKPTYTVPDLAGLAALLSATESIDDATG